MQCSLSIVALDLLGKREFINGAPYTLNILKIWLLPEPSEAGAYSHCYLFFFLIFFLGTKIWVFRRLSWLQMLWLARHSILGSIHCTRAFAVPRSCIVCPFLPLHATSCKSKADNLRANKAKFWGEGWWWKRSLALTLLHAVGMVVWRGLYREYLWKWNGTFNMVEVYNRKQSYNELCSEADIPFIKWI